MVTVSDTSPISSLALIGRLELLRSQFTEVWIPVAVLDELDRIPNSKAKSAIEQAIETGWLRCRALGNPHLAAVLCNDLDKGEAEAIALATEVAADVLLIDEKEGRSLARQAGLSVRGVLGVLIRAKVTGEVGSLKVEIQALRDHARFFVSPALEAEVLRSVSESPR
jgi:predicted nucleic acid-binding protein